jgi:integrase
MANIHRLSERQIRAAQPGPLLADGANLFLQVTLGAHGINKSWVFKYELDGERHELGLGSLASRSLREARGKARELRQLILDGGDPLEARREAKRERLKAKAAQRKAVTFKECAEMCIRVRSSKWRSAVHGQQWETTLKDYAYPTLGNLAVADIDTGHVQRALEPIWTRIPTTARRLRGRIETVLTYATAAKFRSGDNPAGWGILQHLLGGKTASEHLAALPIVEAPALFRELQERKPMPCRALAFTILTAARSGEVLGATWDEIDLRAGVWVVPAARMKGGREHRVPLSDPAVALLNDLPRHGAFVFADRSGKMLNNKVLRTALQRLRPGITVHGCRSTFSDWAHERTTFSNHVIELSLAHSVGNAVEQAYRRGDMFEKRRKLMQAWGAFLTKIIPVSATVTPIRKVSTEAS